MDSEHSSLGQFFLIPIDTDINRAMPKSNTCKERILGQSQIFTLPPPFMGVLVHKVIMDESLQSKHTRNVIIHSAYNLQEGIIAPYFITITATVMMVMITSLYFYRTIPKKLQALQWRIIGTEKIV